MVPKSGEWVGGIAMGIASDTNSSTSSSEGEEECWLLGMMAEHSADDESGVSCLGIFDGADITKGPVAKIKMKHRVPHGLHGAFVPGGRR